MGNLTKFDKATLVITLAFICLIFGWYFGARSGGPSEKAVETTVALSQGDAPEIESGKKLIDINTAGEEELQTLYGIGGKLAGDIVKYREANGKFESIEDIMKVSGIGENKFEGFKDSITAGAGR